MLDAPADAPMELGDYFRILRRRAWVVVVVTMLAVGAAVAWSSTRHETYAASGEIVVAQGNGEVDVATQAKIIQSQAVRKFALAKATVGRRRSGHAGRRERRHQHRGR